MTEPKTMSGDGGSGSAARGGGADPEASAAVHSAPPGWIKKVTTPQKGGTPKNKAIIFIAPTGEELSTKRQVELYLKSHPGGPLISEFYWGAGDTPRRSSRLGEKVKEVPSAEPEPPTKRSRKSVGKSGDDMKTEAAEKVKEVTSAEPEPPTKRSRKSAGKVGDDTKTKAATKEVHGSEDFQMQDTEVATEEVHVSEDVQMHDTEATETEDVVAEKDIEVKVIDAQENSELNNIGDVDAPLVPPDVANVGKEVKVDAQENSELKNIGDVDAPVVPPDVANIWKESIVLEDFADTHTDAAAEGPTEEISSSQHMQMALDAEAKMMDTVKADAPEGPQVKVVVKIHEDPEEQHQGKIIKENGSEQIVKMQDVVSGETEYEDGIAEKQVEDGAPPQPSDPQELQQKGEIDLDKLTGSAEKQVEDASQPTSTLFDGNKDEESGRIDDASLEVEAAETKKPSVENSCINVEGGETKPEELQEKVEIDLEKLPAP